jgi:hypothetical protein
MLSKGLLSIKGQILIIKENIKLIIINKINYIFKKQK